MRIEYAVAARQDRSEIWRWNARRYSVAHAAEYAKFLSNEIRALKDDPNLGRPVSGQTDLRQLVIKRRPSGHGHVAFYRVEGDTVQIVRVLHTSRDWPDILEDETS